MDPRVYGKMPFGGDEPEAKEEDEEDENLFPAFSARSQHDRRVMVLALTQVIGNQQSNSHDSPVYNPQDPSKPVAPSHQDQGIYYIIYIYMFMSYIIWKFCEKLHIKCKSQT